MSSIAYRVTRGTDPVRESQLPMATPILKIAASIACTCLSACGGGADTEPQNPDPPPVTPRISVADAGLAEGDSGQAELPFIISLDTNSASDVSVDYATSDGTAAAGSDYVAASGTATIAAGATSTTVGIAIIGDADVEQNESFTLTLSGAVNATISDGTAIGTISNDDTGQISGLASRPCPPHTVWPAGPCCLPSRRAAGRPC